MSRDWLEEGSVEAKVQEKVCGWLFSVVNDISRVQVTDMIARSVSEYTDADALDRYAVKKLEKIEEANAMLEKAYVAALGMSADSSSLSPY